MTRVYGDYWEVSQFQDIAVAITQDLFIAQPADPLNYIRDRLVDWVNQEDDKKDMTKLSPEAIELGNEYLAKHNVRMLS